MIRMNNIYPWSKYNYENLTRLLRHKVLGRYREVKGGARGTRKDGWATADSTPAAETDSGEPELITQIKSLSLSDNHFDKSCKEDPR